jgi:hypothetical protein
VKKYVEYSHLLKDEKRKLENEIISKDQFTKNIQNQHKNEKFELDRKI